MVTARKGKGYMWTCMGGVGFEPWICGVANRVDALS
jgi:hypothetical protein